jgi:4-methyl-5(b-hydroxyethyl)-thiazole monophosphate biosynthesis
MVYVFLATGFEELEALAPIDLLRRAGLNVVTVGVGSNEIVASHGVTFKTDINAEQIKLCDELQMVVLPGGMPGSDNLENSPEVQAAVDYCSENNKYVGAICAAPKILGHKGLLAGRYCTCFPGYESELTHAVPNGQSVVVDGNFITAKGAGVSIQFGLKLVEVLLSKEKATALGVSLQCK